MKHLLFGVGLLAALLVLGLWLGSALEPAYEPAARDLEKAAGCVRDGDWALAAALSARAKQSWESRRNLTAALINHDVPDQIDQLFIQLENSAAWSDASSVPSAAASASA